MRSSGLFIMFSLCKRAASFEGRMEGFRCPNSAPLWMQDNFWQPQKENCKHVPARDPQQAALLLPGRVWEETQHLCLTWQRERKHSLACILFMVCCFFLSWRAICIDFLLNSKQLWNRSGISVSMDRGDNKWSLWELKQLASCPQPPSPV